MMRLLIVAGVCLSAAAIASSPCSTYTSCSSCLGDGSFCGWCSPSGVVYNNGTQGPQCQDQRLAGWTCSHLYSTGVCEPGWVCTSAGTCVQTAPGQGDTKANCELHCHAPPADLVDCETTTQQCVPCHDYCKTNADCPGSYCQGGLCHGSTCQQSNACSASCSSDTPDELLGVWRGLQIQSGYGSGEYAFKFQKRADGPQVSFHGPDGHISSGSLFNDRATGGRDLVITYTDGPLTGLVYKGAYLPWEPSTQTEQDAFYFGAPNDDAPASVQDAMAGGGKVVLVMSRCGGHASSCNFGAVFPPNRSYVPHRPALRASSFVSPADPCSPFPTCGDCLAAPSGLCGWCSTNVTYTDGSAGRQCAGFDQSGQPLGWTCSGTFNKDSCMDHKCDWSDIDNPKCVPCQSGDPGCVISSDQCSTTCVTPPPQYKCNSTTSQCEQCAIKYCNSDKDCPGSYCNIHGPGPWTCHGGSSDTCIAQASCQTSCGSATQWFLCDSFSGTCIPTTPGHPGAITKYDCEHGVCQKHAPTGTWRGIQISEGFNVGEWDFTFYDDSTLHFRAPDGSISIADLQGLNLTQPTDQAYQVNGTVTQSPSHPSWVGSAFFGLYFIDEQGNNNIVSNLFWAQAEHIIRSFAEGMTGAEFVMVTCRNNKYCDFSRSEVPQNSASRIIPLVWDA